MRKLLTIVIIVICSISSSAGMKEDYAKRKEEQKYRFKEQIREVKQQGRLDLIKAKNDQKVRSRYRRRYRGRNYCHGRMYSNRQCP